MAKSTYLLKDYGEMATPRRQAATDGPRMSFVLQNGS